VLPVLPRPGAWRRDSDLNTRAIIATLNLKKKTNLKIAYLRRNPSSGQCTHWQARPIPCGFRCTKSKSPGPRDTGHWTHMNTDSDPCSGRPRAQQGPDSTDPQHQGLGQPLRPIPANARAADAKRRNPQRPVLRGLREPFRSHQNRAWGPDPPGMVSRCHHMA
jgi:hypothetical protein